MLISYTYFTTGATKGLLQTVDDPLFTTGVSTYAYDTAGRVTSRTDGTANIAWTRAYEPETSRVDLQRIVKNPGASETELGEFDLGYDEAGNVTSRYFQVGTATSDPRNATTSYVYDAGNRLTSLTGPDPASSAGTTRTWTFDYDGAGNREAYAVGGTTYAYVLDQQGWPTSFNNGTPGSPADDTTYTWDPAGNLTGIDVGGTTAGDWTFTLDAWGWQTAATPGSGQAISQTFDAFGRVISRTQGAQTTELTYEGTGETLARQVLGATTTTYASTPGGPLAQKVGSGVAEYLLRDLHGDVVGLVGSSSTTPAARAYYSPWGEPTWSAAAPALGFQSQRTDSATGQVDMTTRNYVPGLGRFVAPDALFGELTAPLSLNGFAYVQANPVTMSDPLGLFGCDEDQKCQSRPPCRPWPACSGAGADPGPGGVTTSTSSSDTSSDAETVAFPYPSIYVPFSDPMPAPGGWDLCAQAIAVVGGTLAPYSSGCQPGPRTGDIIDRQAPPIGEQVACFSCGRSEDERLAGPCGDATKVASCLGTGVGVALGVLGGLGRLGCAVGLGSTGFSSDCGGPKGPDVVYSKESPQDVIAPGGKLIGKSWKKPGVRTLPGGSI